MNKSLFPALVADNSLVYLDSAATAQVPQPVLDALLEAEAYCRGNVRRAAHRLAERASEAYEQARKEVSHYLGCPSSELVFTSGATAGLNGLAQAICAGLPTGTEVVVSGAEHHSNYLPWRYWAGRLGLNLKMIPLAADGQIDMAAAATLITPRTAVVAVTHGSNVTGSMTDLAALSQLTRCVDALLVVDGAQVAPHGPLHVAALGVDAYVISGHKCYGPTGIGALWARSELLAKWQHFNVGGGMVGQISAGGYSALPAPHGFEAGTPPLAAAIGLGAAARWLSSLDWPTLAQQQWQLQQQLRQALAAIEGVTVIGPNTASLPLVSFTVAGCHPHDICHLLDDAGVALRGGHLCAQPLLSALGVDGVVRASLGLYNNRSDIDALVAALADAITQLR